jgi:DNA-binding LacI/PurR family transcriptional regulator
MEAGIEIDEDLVLQPLQSEFSFVARLEKAAARGKMPQGVFSAGGGQRLKEVIRWAADRGSPLTVAAADCTPIDDLWSGAEYRACEDPEEMGRTAARLLLDRIGGHTGPARRVEVPCTMMRVQDGKSELIETAG